jgi:hypothetical protein
MFSSMVSTMFWPGSGSCSLEPSTLRRASMAVYMRPGAPCSLRLVLLLQAAQPVVVHAHIAQHLRGDLVVGIEALKLLLRIDALDVQSLHLGCTSGVTRRATHAKLCPLDSRSAICVLAGQRVFRDRCAPRPQARAPCLHPGGALLVVDLAGHGIEGVGLHRHGQLMQVAVVEHAAPRSHFKGAQLLLLRALLNSLWRTTCSQNSRPPMARAQSRKNRQISQKRARLRGMVRVAAVAAPAGSDRITAWTNAPGL